MNRRTRAGPIPDGAHSDPDGPLLRLVGGCGQRTEEPLDSREAVIRVLVEAGADLLLHRISPERAEEIRRRVEQILTLFERVNRSSALIPTLKLRLDELEALMRETRSSRSARGGI